MCLTVKLCVCVQELCAGGYAPCASVEGQAVGGDAAAAHTHARGAGPAGTHLEQQKQVCEY